MGVEFYHCFVTVSSSLVSYVSKLLKAQYVIYATRGP